MPGGQQRWAGPAGWENRPTRRQGRCTMAVVIGFPLLLAPVVAGLPRAPGFPRVGTGRRARHVVRGVVSRMSVRESNRILPRVPTRKPARNGDAAPARRRPVFNGGSGAWAGAATRGGCCGLDDNDVFRLQPDEAQFINCRSYRGDLRYRRYDAWTVSPTAGIVDRRAPYALAREEPVLPKLREAGLRVPVGVHR